VLELYIKYGSNICYSHRDQHTYPPDVHLMTSRESTSGFDFWSLVVSVWPWCISHKIWSRCLHPVQSY